MNNKTKTDATVTRATEDKRLGDAELDEIVGGLQATALDTNRTSRRTVGLNEPLDAWDLSAE